LDEELTCGEYKFNHCAAFEYLGRKYVVGFRLVKVREEKGYEFDVLKVFKMLREEKWYFHVMDKLKDVVMRNKSKILFFMKQKLGEKNKELGLEEFRKICQYLYTVNLSNSDDVSLGKEQVFIDDVENYAFDDIEDLKKEAVSFEEKKKEFKRKNYVSQRDKDSFVFDNYFEMKLFFGWITSYKMRMSNSEFNFIFFENYYDFVKHFQK
jgi:hypothetical protein